MTQTESKIFDIYLTIKQDLVNNFKDVFNRQNHYIRKYRGNVTLDINVGIDDSIENEKFIQIFVRENGKWIRDRLILNSSNHIVESELKHNLYE